jgi:hypothetical protein
LKGQHALLLRNQLVWEDRGMVLVGCHYDESTIYRAAAAFEQVGDWKRM